VQGKVEHVPRHPKDINTIPYAPQDGYPLISIPQRATGDHQKEDAEPLSRCRRSWRTARIDLHRIHLPHSAVPCLASWWSRFIVCPWSCNGSWYVVTHSCLYRNLLFLCWWCLMLKVWPPCFSGRSRGSHQHIVIINRFRKDYLRVVTVRGEGKC
jgi:hypothetical protein